MKLFAKRVMGGLALVFLLCILLAYTKLTYRRHVPVNLPDSLFCECSGRDGVAPPVRIVFYLDLNCCLSCNEDMDSWRRLCTKVRERGGAISVFAKRSDSADVAWAMHLEGISDTTRVLDDRLVDALDWRQLGTPVKLLLDSRCRQLKIGGFMGNREESKQFIDHVLELACAGDHGIASRQSLQ
jgi:hypothetical protein